MFQRALTVGGGGSSKVAFGIVPKPTVSTSDLHIETGFVPKKIMWTTMPSTATYICDYYWDNDKNPSKFYGRQGAANLRTNGANVGGDSYFFGLKSIDATDGFHLEHIDVTNGANYMGDIWWAASAE